MNLIRSLENMEVESRRARSRSAQGLSASTISSPSMKIPLPPRLWITDISDESSDDTEGIVRDDNILSTERVRVRSRFRHHKSRSANIPIGIFWDIENCQVPRGCSALDVVSAIRAKFLPGRREADFVVVCDVRKELAHRLQELNDAQISLIHVCGTQKNAADEKLRQCMRRFGELHAAPAALLLISGDINFAADLSDFRYRKNMEVILVHKTNTSQALIACATAHYCYNDVTAHLPRNPKVSQTEEEEPTCEMEILNLPTDQPPERVSRRLRRLADNCGGKVLRVTAQTAMLKFPTPDHASRALKRMDGEDVFGYKIGTRYARAPPHAYSSDEGYGTATQLPPPTPPTPLLQQRPVHTNTSVAPPIAESMTSSPAITEWSLALQLLPPPPPPAPFCPPPPPQAPYAVPSQFIPPQVKPRKIRGAHGISSFDQSACSSSHSGDDSRSSQLASRAGSPWNSSAFSEQSDDLDSIAELTVSNLPPFEPKTLKEMLTQLFSQYVQVLRVSVWPACDGPIATVAFRSEWDARLAIARVHKRRLDNQWTGRRLELSLGRPSPAPNLEVLRARLRAILLDQKNYTLPLLRLRDAYASRHCCALSTSDIAKVRDTVIIHEGFGRMVQLVDTSPVASDELEEAPWKCHIHAALNTGHEDGSKILAPVYMEVALLTQHVKILLKNHGGILPLLSFVECYEAMFPALSVDPARGVALELLLRSAPELSVRDSPSRHLAAAAAAERAHTPSPNSTNSDSERSSKERERGRTAPALEPMLSLFERELIDLLRTAPRCSIPFSKLIPAFHHHFGRQCRVADYGFTKLPDLLAALSNTIVVLGSGSSRIITISAAAQSRRWTTDLLKLLRNQPGRAIFPLAIPQLYQLTFGRAFSPVDYGVCTLQELMQRVSPQAIVYHQDGSIALPRRTPTPEEKSRTLQFSVQAIELLCYTPNLRMDFSRFVPAFHAHFGKQLRVAHYGCVKLVELFELIPESVRIFAGTAGEREVRLALKPARVVIGQRLRAVSDVPIENFPAAYTAQFSAPPQPDMLDAVTMEELVIAAGGAIEGGLVKAPGEAPGAVSMSLAAVAALSEDRSVRGSSDEYFIAAFREIYGQDPNMAHLLAAGVVSRANRRVQLGAAWRAVWRSALVLAAVGRPLTTPELYLEYTKRFEPTFPCTELGFENILEFLRHYREVFAEDGAQRFSVSPGVLVPRHRALPPRDEFNIQDTPPGQKGSRVFESPKTNIWCSPPASALPAPSALLSHDKRRTRLAAQFNAA